MVLTKNVFNVSNLAGIFVLVLSVVLYLISRLCIMKANPKTSQMQKAMIKEKYLVDYVYYVFFVMLKNAIGDTGTLVSIWKSSKSGIILHATLIIGGFLVFEYYLSTDGYLNTIQWFFLYLIQNFLMASNLGFYLF